MIQLDDTSLFLLCCSPQVIVLPVVLVLIDYCLWYLLLSHHPSSHLMMPALLSSLIALIFLFALSTAHDRRDGEPVIYNESKKYNYYGCYNETVQVADSAQVRALDGGTNLIKKGSMTVDMCLDFCQKSGSVEYTYAGLEWSR